MEAGMNGNLCPANSPMMASPVSCCHQVWVCRSYMIRSLFRKLPDTPKSNTRPSNVRLKAKAELHSGQKVTMTGSPPTTSFTTSCQVRMASG